MTFKDELLYTYPEIRDDAGRGLIWTDAPSIASPALYVMMHAVHRYETGEPSA